MRQDEVGCTHCEEEGEVDWVEKHWLSEKRKVKSEKFIKWRVKSEEFIKWKTKSEKWIDNHH